MNIKTIEFSEEEYVGKFQIRQDIEVLPSDEVKSKTIGWTIGRTYSGCEVLFSDSEDTIKNKKDLIPGMIVLAWDLQWVVAKYKSNYLYLDRDNNVGTLEFSKDDRNCCVCPSIINKKLLSLNE